MTTPQEFIQLIADMLLTDEVDATGDVYVQSDEDAQATLANLITLARQIQASAIQSPERERVMEAARANFCAQSNDEIEVDEDARVIESEQDENGQSESYWVQAWLFVHAQDL